MVHSMTGYGKQTASIGEKMLTVEIKSLNSKYLDLNVRLPHLYREKEIALRKMLSSKLARGKVDLQISVEHLGGNTALRLNAQLLKQYLAELQKIAYETNNSMDGLLPSVLRIPDVLSPSRSKLTTDEWHFVADLVNKTFDALLEFRKQEGKSLYTDLSQNIQAILDNLIQVENLAPQRVAHVKTRLRQSLKEIAEATKVDPNRFEQELAYYLEKLDINEEIVRLKSHCTYFLATLKGTKSTKKGKKLGFIAQEIGREINTIGAKANFAPIQNHVVRMKDALDKVKEQSMNVL